MLGEKKSTYMYDHTILFAQRVVETIDDLAGLKYSINKGSFSPETLNTTFDMTACMHFAGPIQGDYFISLSKETAAGLASSSPSGKNDTIPVPSPDDFGDFLCETLNVSVGRSLDALAFEDVTSSSPWLVLGTIILPNVTCGTITLEGEAGPIRCTFSLNLANLRIRKKLEDTLKDLEIKTRESQEAKKNIQSILKFFPEGMVTINRNEKIFPGYSRATPSVVGLNKDKDIANLSFSYVIGMRDTLVTEWKEWLLMVFSEFGSMPFNFFLGQCPLGEFTNQRGKYLSFQWYPITSSRDDAVEKLLVIIEDKTV